MNYYLTDFPIEYSEEDYLKVENSFLEYFDKFDPKAIYKFGKNKLVYGISDLDYILVPGSSKTIKPYSLWGSNFDSKFRYILSHGPLVLSEVSLKKIHQFYLLFNLKQISGATIPLKKKKAEFDLVNLLHFINLYYPREFLNYRFKRKIKIKAFLGSLNRFAHTLTLYLVLLKEKNRDYSSFISEIQKLRENWFHQQASKQIIEAYLDTAIRLSLDLIQNLSNHLSKKDLWSIKNRRINFFINPCQSLIFKESWNSNSALLLSEKIYRKTRIISSVLPMNLTPFFWKTSNDILQKRVSNSFLTKPLVEIKNPSFNECFKQRQEIIDQQIQDYRIYGEDCLNPSLSFLYGLINFTYQNRIKMFLKQSLIRWVQ